MIDFAHFIRQLNYGEFSKKKEKSKTRSCNFESFSTVIYIGMQFVFFQTG